MEKEMLKLVGNRIRDIRKAKGLSQEALGERGGFHFSYIGQIERGEKNVALTNLAKIAKALDVNVYKLFSFEFEDLDESDRDLKDIILLLKEKNPEHIKIMKQIIHDIYKITDNTKSN